MAERDSTTESPTSASSLPLPDGKDYHAFICFNIADQEWVDETIAYLESSEIRLKCVDHRRDFHAGKTTIRNIEEFIERSWKYVLIMSPDFVASEWCSFETDIMMNLSLEQREECIIPVLLKPCTVPKSLKSFTYIDVSQSGRWRDKLLKAIRRADISSKRSTLSSEKLLEDSQGLRERFKQTAEHYQQDKDNVKLEEDVLEKQINDIFDVCTNNMQVLMDERRKEKIEELHFQMDKRRATLVQKRDAAQKLLFHLESNLKNDHKPLKNFTGLLNEFEEMEVRQGEMSSFTEFVESEMLVDKMTELMSEFDVGHLRNREISYVKSQEDRDIFLKERALSWTILPQKGAQTPRSIVKCPYFQFDRRTVWKDGNILHDGFLSNKAPPRQHPQSERRLKNYYGAVGTTRFMSRGIYYWENNLNVNLEKELEGELMVFEVSLSARGVIDERYTMITDMGTLVLNVSRCLKHTTNNACLNVYKDNVKVHHQTLLPNITGQWPPLVLGFLLDTIRHRWTVYDVTKKEEITTVEDISEVEEFTPMFGVYARRYGSIKLSLTTGRDLKISDDMYNLIERALD